jgi:hypothetical protein
VPGNHLTSEVTVEFHDLQVAVGGTVRALEVGRDHADEAPRMVGQRCGLDCPESRCGGDFPVRREARVSVDIVDDDLGASLRRPSACGTVLVNNGEAVEELPAEPGLGHEPQ